MQNEGIWDKAGFGSRGSPYSVCSVCASDPPVIVDEDGTYLGRLTLTATTAKSEWVLGSNDWLHGSVCH